jgi:hypothetical protein
MSDPSVISQTDQVDVYPISGGGIPECNAGNICHLKHCTINSLVDIEMHDTPL